VVDDDSSDEEDGLTPGSGSETRHKKRKPGERGGGKPRRWVIVTLYNRERGEGKPRRWVIVAL